MAFRAKVEDVYRIASREGVALCITHVEGDPKLGDQVRVSARIGTVMGVSTMRVRSCLGGYPIPRSIDILVDFGDDDWSGLSGFEIVGGENV